MSYETTITTGTSTVTHQYLACGCLCYCSAAVPWEPQREWGWCMCGDESDEEYPMPVGTSPWDPTTMTHNHYPRMDK